jgi:hypothetical protein
MFLSITSWLTGIRCYPPRMLPNNQRGADRLFLEFSADPAVGELHTEHVHGMPAEEQAF